VETTASKRAGPFCRRTTHGRTPIETTALCDERHLARSRTLASDCVSVALKRPPLFVVPPEPGSQPRPQTFCSTATYSPVSRVTIAPAISTGWYMRMTFGFASIVTAGGPAAPIAGSSCGTTQ
jgi:hypothetical protein